MVYNNSALYMLLYKQCGGFYCCSKRVVNARSVFQEHHLVCPSQNAFNSSSPYTVENASNAALIPTSPEMKPGLVAVGSATVAVLSQSSGIAAILP